VPDATEEEALFRKDAERLYGDRAGTLANVSSTR
jgi:hypothetical protein